MGKRKSLYCSSVLSVCHHWNVLTVYKCGLPLCEVGIEYDLGIVMTLYRFLQCHYYFEDTLPSMVFFFFFFEVELVQFLVTSLSPHYYHKLKMFNCTIWKVLPI